MNFAMEKSVSALVNMVFMFVDIKSCHTSNAPKLVIRTELKARTMPTENTMREARPCFRMAFCTISNPMSDPRKHRTAYMDALKGSSIPSSRYSIDDIVEEKNTMNEHVAAVT
ncbi:hypothetical protein Leryth_025155 [Lithospermum erythrorhizon]|nr:hypothetical protein Leryth_025155 [Lithospermum erythrorhizon]